MSAKLYGQHIGLKHRRGVSLVELMVSLAIGLVITVAVLSAYMGASSSTKLSDAQVRMNEDAQAALTILSRELRMAGNNPKQANRLDNTQPDMSSLRNPVYWPTPFPADDTNTFTYSGFDLAWTELRGLAIRGCDGGFQDPAAASIDALTCNTTQTGSDAIAVTYEADEYNTIPTSGGKPTDCVGSGLTAQTATVQEYDAANPTSPKNVTATYYVADNRYYIGSTANLPPSLYCKGKNSSTQPLVQNIEDLQLTYGTLKPGAGAQVIAGYLTATQVVNQTLLAALNTDAERWMNVVAVRVCIVVRSEDPVAPSAASAKYRDCTGTLVDAPDQRLRRAYFSTVALPNEIFH